MVMPLGKCRGICLSENGDSATSVSTSKYVPQPLENRWHIVCNRLFVGGLPQGTTVKDLVKIFGNYGKIIGCNVMPCDSKNYGFVTFEDVYSAAAVLNMASRKGFFFVAGLGLKVKPAAFRPKKALKGQTEVDSTKHYRGRQDILRYYGGATRFETTRDVITGFPGRFCPVMVPNLVAFPPAAPVSLSRPSSSYGPPYMPANQVMIQPRLSTPVVAVGLGYQGVPYAPGLA